MKKLFAALIVAACAFQVDGHRVPSGHPQADTAAPPYNNPQVDRLKPSYHTVRAYVGEVDTEEWYGYCGDFIGNAVYGFEILDEFNVGDNVRVVVCDNATPLIRYDDYVVQVHYGW